VIEAWEAPHPVELLRMAFATFRAEPARVLVPALLIFGLDAFSDTGFTEISVDHFGLESLIGVVALAFSTLGLTFYSGLLEKLVGSVERNLSPEPLGQVLRTIPYGRLLLADAILWAVTALSSLVFVLPGLVIATLCVLVGPAITVHGTTVRQAFRTSITLVSPRFLPVLCLITLPLALAHESVVALALLVPHENLGLVFVTNMATGVVFGVVLGLVEVALAERLLHGARGPGVHLLSQAYGSAPESGPAPEGGGGGQGGHDGRDDSRNDDAGTRAHPPAG
jgi:hypothetical protein